MKRERLGDRIKRLRKQRELGLRETAGKLGISASYLSLIETGQVKTPPAPKVIADVARLLEDDFDALLLLAGRVPEDIEDALVADPALTTFLRTASEQGLSGKDLIDLLAAKKARK
jgi:HTH-type transcriptional regulator, competence development regulator